MSDFERTGKLRETSSDPSQIKSLLSQLKAHEDFSGRFVQSPFRFDLPWLAEHAGSIEEKAPSG
jgi:hypothetical protein